MVRRAALTVQCRARVCAALGALAARVVARERSLAAVAVQRHWRFPGAIGRRRAYAAARSALRGCERAAAHAVRRAVAACFAANCARVAVPLQRAVASRHAQLCRAATSIATRARQKRGARRFARVAASEAAHVGARFALVRRQALQRAVLLSQRAWLARVRGRHRVAAAQIILAELREAAAADLSA